MPRERNRSRELRLVGGPVLQRGMVHALDPAVRFVSHRGGTRSGKTYSIVQTLVSLAFQRPNWTISVVRKYLPSLKTSALRDFQRIMVEADLWEDARWSKTDLVYEFPRGTTLEFFSVDDAAKVRGRRRNCLFLNECNEVSYEDWFQLNNRTDDRVFLDYNPSDTEGWWYDVEERPNCRTVVSTYRDNPFLPEGLRRELDAMETTADEQYYRVYALGERPTFDTRVYRHFTESGPPDPKDVTRTTYGVDWGWTDPTVVVRVDWLGERRVHVTQLFNRSGAMVDEVLKEVGHLLGDGPVLCDSAEPDKVEAFRRAGLDARGADKSAGSIVSGINAVRSVAVSVDPASREVWEEFRRYQYRILRTGELSDGVPLGRHDHTMDAIRYAVTCPSERERTFAAYSF